ncbi:hypothetical protein CALVIDRAFT_529616 [Calocera viscosa TUFC12733]|uniref:Peroxin-14 n=1 Tax=Calocera viscosa (strain TUFC12733) TaxID=1330018 RepID=A0A167J2R2_CALVF|nr:hypothetical protein CALVIDRAFT_529616 [Calocera viscosa TUFC12733]
MPPPPPPPSRPRSPPPCPPPPPPSPVHRADAPQQAGEAVVSSTPTSLGMTSSPTLPKRDYTPILPAIILPAATASQLLPMLRTLARVLSWLGATGGIAGFVYYRYILPRLDETLARRAALRAHALALATRLASQLHTLHASQSSRHALPEPSPPAPTISALPPALSALQAAHEPRASSQRALQALSSLSSYVSARTYGPLPRRADPAVPAPVAAPVVGLESAEHAWEASLACWEREAEGVLREIRAVKGLVLNRRSFAGAV